MAASGAAAGTPPVLTANKVGEAYRFLLDLRLDEGVVGEAEAEKRLREWWAARG